MPIVAGIGGNTGNQTITMIVRALALHQIEVGNISRLLLRELGVAIINGVVWGGIMGVVTWLLYGDLAMGGVMTLAMILNLLVAALMGVVIPMTMLKLGRDPAVGSSVLITALTDTGGFFIFLGLARYFCFNRLFRQRRPAVVVPQVQRGVGAPRAPTLGIALNLARRHAGETLFDQVITRQEHVRP